ncbi:hypothetical protein ANRL2_01743 [Anaerolineae bacterium]|nr:hypothetical protein ANRL2_01743 [Anaerolineae bacterium]
MNWQEPAALVVVAGTFLLILVQRIRRFRQRGMSRCGTSCHCPPLASADTKPYLASPPIGMENRS